VEGRAAVGANGPPHAVWAAAGDRDGAVETPRESAPNLTKAGKALCGGGCRGENFAGAARALRGAAAVKRNELRTFVAPPRRLEKFLRLWKNCEPKMHNSLHMTLLAFLSLLLKKY
jgi:hypothetical protein